MRIRAKNVVSGVSVTAAAGAAAIALTACSPSLEAPSDMPRGQEVPMSLSAPASLSPAPKHGADDGAVDEACPIGDFTVEGDSGSKPSIVVPEQCETPTKLQQTVLEPGSGPKVNTGDTVSVNYVLVGVTSGKEVTSWTSPTETTPEEITVGDGDVIPGWDTALVGMRPGGRTLVVIPPKQGAAANQGAAELDFEETETLALVIELAASN